MPLAGSNSIHISLIRLVKLYGLFPNSLVSETFSAKSLLKVLYQFLTISPNNVYKNSPISSLWVWFCQALIAFASHLFMTSGHSYGSQAAKFSMLLDLLAVGNVLISSTCYLLS